MYDYNQPRYIPPYPNQQMYYQPYYPQPFYPMQPVYVPTPVQENGVPITPLYDEKKWIKHFYSWTGSCLLIHLGIALVMGGIVAVIAAIIMSVLSTGSINFQSFSQQFSADSGNLPIIMALATAIPYLTANLTVFKIGCSVTKIKPRALFKFNGFSGKLVLSSVAVALCIQTVVIIVMSIAIYLLESAGIDLTSYLDLNQPTNFTADIILSVYTCIIAPITEELVFRGLCLKNLSRFNQRFGIFASAFLFGLVHGNIIQFVLAFSLGILLAYITIKANSIIPAIIVHFTVNTSSTILDEISKINESVGSTVNVIWYIATFAIGLAVLIIALVKFKVRLPQNTIPQKKRGLPVFVSSVPMMIISGIYSLMVVVPLLFLPFLFLLK